MSGLAYQPDGSDIAARYREGQSIIVNCNIGFGVKLGQDDDGMVRIEVAEHIDVPLGCDALREFMEKVAVSWLTEVAPHRLASAADYCD